MKPIITHFVKCLKERLQAAYRLAQVNISKSQSHARHLYNKKTRGSSLQIGDRVLVQNVGIRGKHKLADLWENTPYVISDAPMQDMPVYKVKPENAKGPIKTLHRNLLLPIDVIPSKCDLKQSSLNSDETESELRQMRPNGNSDEDILSPDEDSEYEITNDSRSNDIKIISLLLITHSVIVVSSLIEMIKFLFLLLSRRKIPKKVINPIHVGQQDLNETGELQIGSNLKITGLLVNNTIFCLIFILTLMYNH